MIHDMYQLPRLEETLLHKPPMLLLEELVSFDPERKECVVSAALSRSAPYWDQRHGRPRTHWFAELIAQCVAVNYFLQVRASGAPPRRGFLVAIDQFSVNSAYLEPPPGDVLVTSVMEAEVYPFGVFSGTVLRQSGAMAQATMKFLTDDGRIGH